MTAEFPFDSFDDGTPMVGGAQRWRGLTRPEQAARLRYRPLERRLAAAEVPPPPEPPAAAYGEDELAAAVAAAREQAYAEAAAAVEAELRASLEHQQAAALAAIAAQLASCRSALEQTLAARAGASREIALAIGRALVGEALARQPLADIEAMFRELVLRLEAEPWLEIRLAPGAAAAAEASLLAIAEDAGYRGALRVLPDPRLGPGDARLSWQDGTAERDLARLEAEAAALVEAWLPPRQRSHAPAAQPGAAASPES
jgi:flagellar biosynthesis/type III secretory pathway protein FliH